MAKYILMDDSNYKGTIPYPNVYCHIRSSNDVKDLKKYYYSHVKDLDSSVDEVLQLNELIKKEKGRHRRIVKLKERYSLDDFEPVLDVRCENCRMDGLLKEDAAAGEKCVHCGDWLMPVR